MELADLKKIGLTEGEIKIYEALLELGETTRTKLAKKSGISPSKIYDVANRLIEKGIISSVKKNGILHFSAANPERIKDFLEQKEVEIQKEKQLVDDILPSLLLKYNKTDEEVDVDVYYGWDGLGGRIEIRCFNENPSVKSSLKFLRKTPWARKKVEDLFIYTLEKYGTNDAETTGLIGKDK